MFSVKNHTNHSITIDGVVIPGYGEKLFNKFVNKNYINSLLNNHTISIIVKNDVSVPREVSTKSSLEKTELLDKSVDKPKTGRKKPVSESSDINITDNMKGDMNNAAD